MRKIFVFFLLLLPSIYGAKWLIEHPGKMDVTWLGYRVETYSSLFFIAAIFALIAIWAVVSVIRSVIFAPARNKTRRQLSRQKKGVDALSHAVIALATHDTKSAKSALAKAEKLLPELAATPLLKAQLAHSEGKQDAAQFHLQQLTEHQDTAFLGYSALARTALRAKQYDEAQQHALRAFKQSPSNPSVAELCIEAALRNSDWAVADEIIRKATRAKAINKSDAHELLAMMHTHRAQLAHQKGEFELSEGYVKQALKVKAHFLPAVIEDASVLADRGDKRSLHRLLAAQWKYAPNPKLADIYAHALEDSSPNRQVKSFDKLIKSAPEHPESHVAAAKIAIATANWDRARNELKIALTKLQTARIYRLMAQVEKSENGDSKNVQEWLNRAVEAPLDEAWVCNQCGSVHDEWEMFCSSCDAFHSIHWHMPGRIIREEKDIALLA